MKINEFTTNLNTYIANVCVVLRNGTTMAKTHVIADGINQARMMLMRLYGEGNVVSISKFVSESGRTCEIQTQQSDLDQEIQRQRQTATAGSVLLSCVSEAGENTKVLSSSQLQIKSLADQATRLNQQAKLKKAQTKLTKAQDKLRSANAANKSNT